MDAARRPQEGTPDAAQLSGCGFYLNLSEEMAPSESSGSKHQAEKTPARRCMDRVSLPTQCSRY